MSQFNAQDVPTLRTVKATRGDALVIDLGKTFLGTLTAWMKKDPTDGTYRSFEIVSNRYLKLSQDKTIDYYDGDGVLIETVGGRWFFDVEQLLDGQDPEESKTIYKGSILFENDITNSVAIESTEAGIAFDLAKKEDKINKGVANGYAPLDENAKVPLEFLPDINIDFVIPVTYSQLVALITASTLEIGACYLLTDYMTTYTQPNTSVTKTSGIVEPLFIYATGLNTLNKACRSKLYPQDIVFYEVTGNIGDGNGTEGFTKGKIFRRIDTLRNNDIGTDWRHVKYDRSGVDKLLFEDYTVCYNNKIDTYFLFDSVVGSNFYDNIIGDVFLGNTVLSNFSENRIGNFFYSNQVQSNFSGNKIGSLCIANEIGNNFSYNAIGNGFSGNIIGNDFVNNVVENDISALDLTLVSELYGKSYSHSIYKIPSGQSQFSYTDNYGDLIIEDIV